ncbi:hypothetical protein C2E23DRAFT_622169 [Lenzites betulinus]|nr:hypothetical protein C2E23DRAFT_622169 [Lenzites betulinus]
MTITSRVALFRVARFQPKRGSALSPESIRLSMYWKQQRLARVDTPEHKAREREAAPTSPLLALREPEQICGDNASAHASPAYIRRPILARPLCTHGASHVYLVTRTCESDRRAGTTLAKSRRTAPRHLSSTPRPSVLWRLFCPPTRGAHPQPSPVPRCAKNDH